MSNEGKDPAAAVKRCYAGWAEDYFDSYFGPDAPYPPVHRALIQDLLDETQARTLLDAGCGPASMLRDLDAGERQLYGFDLTPEMVAEARRVMAERGLPAERLWQGDVTDPAAFRPPGGSPETFDAVTCVGVLPHVPEAVEDTVLANLRNAAAPGGLVVVEARNQLFSLFTLNRYSRDFFMSDLVRAEELEANEAVDLEVVRREFEQRFRTDLPPLRAGDEDAPGYDAVLSRTHNPLTFKERFAAAGFTEVRLLFYHFHALPPMFESAFPEAFRARSVAMEDAGDWRGHFMASAFLVAGRRA